ncbi:MAG: hypothetical protein K2G90_10290 [Muribaculaceae bacterium]|nr:hypothetical protein [Muribaculaceae bacterium]
MPPYYIYPDIVALQEGRATEENIRRIAANIGDTKVVRRLVSIDPEEFGSFYPDMGTHTPSTFNTIDTFLSTYSRENRQSQAPAPPRSHVSVEDLIKNGKYEIAIERIKEQNLNNPEKSIYFADQIRFLRKLIRLQKATEALPDEPEN